MLTRSPTDAHLHLNVHTHPSLIIFKYLKLYFNGKAGFDGEQYPKTYFFLNLSGHLLQSHDFTGNWENCKSCSRGVSICLFILLKVRTWKSVTSRMCQLFCTLRLQRSMRVMVSYFITGYHFPVNCVMLGKKWREHKMYAHLWQITPRLGPEYSSKMTVYIIRIIFILHNGGK